MSTQHTPGPWRVRTLQDDDGTVIDCFVTAEDVNGFAFGAEILGDDEYRGDIGRMLADARLIAESPAMLDLLKELIDLEGPQPGNSAWAGRVKEIINRIEGSAT